MSLRSTPIENPYTPRVLWARDSIPFSAPKPSRIMTPDEARDVIDFLGGEVFITATGSRGAFRMGGGLLVNLHSTGLFFDGYMVTGLMVTPVSDDAYTLELIAIASEPADELPDFPQWRNRFGAIVISRLSSIQLDHLSDAAEALMGGMFSLTIPMNAETRAANQEAARRYMGTSDDIGDVGCDCSSCAAARKVSAETGEDFSEARKAENLKLVRKLATSGDFMSAVFIALADYGSTEQPKILRDHVGLVGVALLAGAVPPRQDLPEEYEREGFNEWMRSGLAAIMTFEHVIMLAEGVDEAAGASPLDIITRALNAAKVPADLVDSLRRLAMDNPAYGSLVVPPPESRRASTSTLARGLAALRVAGISPKRTPTDLKDLEPAGSA